MNYHGTEVFEVPANGQGLAALMAFRLIEEGDMAVDPAAGNHSGRNSAGYALTYLYYECCIWFSRRVYEYTVYVSTDTRVFPLLWFNILSSSIAGTCIV